MPAVAMVDGGNYKRETRGGGRQREKERQSAGGEQKSFTKR
jgi:hypothetical protein